LCIGWRCPWRRYRRRWDLSELRRRAARAEQNQETG
jgi:hypothetical protein